KRRFPLRVRTSISTLADVAREAGVSPMTASRVFAEKSPVAAKTRERVLDAAQRLGYRPNHLARSLRQSQTRTLGLLINAGWWYVDVMGGAQDVAREQGYSIVHALLGRTAADEQEQIETLRRRRVDGMLLMSGSNMVDHAHLRALRMDGVPLVTINRYW